MPTPSTLPKRRMHRGYRVEGCFTFLNGNIFQLSKNKNFALQVLLMRVKESPGKTLMFSQESINSLAGEY